MKTISIIIQKGKQQRNLHDIHELKHEHQNKNLQLQENRTVQAS